MDKRLPVRCLKTVFLLLSSDANSQPKQCEQKNCKKQKLCCSPKIKLKDCLQQIWSGAEFHKYAQLTECPVICSPSFWIKWFVNPQSADFYIINWNKVIKSYGGWKKKKRRSRTGTDLRGKCCTTAGN